MHKSTYKADRIRTIVAVGVFSAFAYVCCVLFHFKTGFLTFDLKDAVMTVGAMIFGSGYGLAMALIVSLLEFVTTSTTGIYGLIMNVLSSAAFVCVGSLIYSYKRTMKGAFFSMLASIIAMTTVMMGANLIITPFYMNVSRADVAMMIPTLLLPFNLVKAIFNSALVFLIYNPITKAIRAAGFVKNGEVKTETKKSARSIIVPIVAVIIGAASLAYFFIKLGGSFSFT